MYPEAVARPTGMLSKDGDLLVSHTDRLLCVCMQCAPQAVDIREKDIRAPSARVHNHVLDLAETLEDGADIGLESVRGKARELDDCRGVLLGGFILLLRGWWLKDGCYWK
jgi:hypothetical protein